MSSSCKTSFNDVSVQVHCFILAASTTYCVHFRSSIQTQRYTETYVLSSHAELVEHQQQQQQEHS